MSFLPPNQQCHSTEGKWKHKVLTQASGLPYTFSVHHWALLPLFQLFAASTSIYLSYESKFITSNLYQLPTSSFSMVHLLSVIKNTMLTALANFHTHKAHAHINGRTCVVADVVVGIDAADFFAVENTRVPLLAIHWIVQDVIQCGQPHVWVDASYL